MEIFLQEKHSTIKNENVCVNGFNFPVFFSYGAANSCGVLIAYLGKKPFVLNEQKTDKAGKILIPLINARCRSVNFNKSI